MKMAANLWGPLKMKKGGNDRNEESGGSRVSNCGYAIHAGQLMTIVLSRRWRSTRDDMPASCKEACQMHTWEPVTMLGAGESERLLPSPLMGTANKDTHTHKAHTAYTLYTQYLRKHTAHVDTHHAEDACTPLHHTTTTCQMHTRAPNHYAPGTCTAHIHKYIRAHLHIQTCTGT